MHLFGSLLRHFLVGLSFTAFGLSAAVMPSWESPPTQQLQGTFWRLHWYERGLTNGNPGYERRLRINSPEAVLHPSFGQRIEARENGLILIQAEEDLFGVGAAELYLEMWGGHPGTAGKRATVNGRSLYQFPRFGSEEGHCTYIYPVLPLKVTDLVNGWNAFQLALDQGTTFWGHALVDNACLRVALTNGHADLKSLGLDDLQARVEATPLTSPQEGFTLALRTSEPASAQILRVDFQAWYTGYDENGNWRDTDWHGFTRDRWPVGHAGLATHAPFRTTWDTTMLPAQKNVAVRAAIHFRNATNLVYLTPATSTLVIADHPEANVALYTPPDLPAPFWSRAKQLKSCSFVLELESSRIERAELYAVTWTGGAGAVKDYFKLNGRHFPIAEGARHVVQFTRTAVEPSLLHTGTNTVELLSDTEHHGIEIFYPGPALMVRYRTSAGQNHPVSSKGRGPE